MTLNPEVRRNPEYSPTVESVYTGLIWIPKKVNIIITLLSYFRAVFDEIRGMKYCVLYSPAGRYGVKIENYGKYYNFKTAIT